MGRRKEKHCAKPAGQEARKQTSLIKFEIENPLKFRDKLFVVQSDKFNWTTHFYRGRIFEEEYLVCDIYVHSHLPNWSSDNRIDIRIFNRPIHVVENHFQMKKNCMSCPPFLKWADFMNPENGYIENGKCTIFIYVTDIPKKVPKNPTTMIMDYPGIKNCQLNVGRAKFHVNKELLAFTSRFFHQELRFGVLNSNVPYVIDDVSPIDFKLYLDLVYHPKQYFSAYHAKDILILARRFDNLEVVQACQNVLVEDLNENKLSAKEKAKLTEAYDLETVKDLFNPDNVIRSQIRPRFMPVDYYGACEPATPCVEQLGNVISVSLNSDVEIPPAPPVKVNPPSASSTPSSSSASSSESLPKLNYDEVIVIDDSEEEVEEEEEEEFDISIPSTSGCYGY